MGWRNAYDAPVPVEGDWVVRDFRFHGGETLPELRIHYTTLGASTGEPVLIMHGTTQSGASMLAAPFAGELFGPGQPLDASRYYIILPDALGHGKSSKPSDGMRTGFPKYNYDDMVDAQQRLVTEHLKVRHLRLVLGNSMGGMITLQYGVRHKDETASLWLLDPAGVFSAPETEFMKVALHGGKNPFEIRNGDDLGRLLSKAFGKPPFIPRPILDAQAKEFLANKAIQEKVFSDVMKGNANTEKDVTGLTLPALIVWGDQDRIFAPVYANELHNEIAGSTVTIIPDTGHMLHVEKADAVADAVLAFAR